MILLCWRFLYLVFSQSRNWGLQCYLRWVLLYEIQEQALSTRQVRACDIIFLV